MRPVQALDQLVLCVGGPSEGHFEPECLLADDRCANSFREVARGVGNRLGSELWPSPSEGRTASKGHLPKTR